VKRWSTPLLLAVCTLLASCGEPAREQHREDHAFGGPVRITVYNLPPAAAESALERALADLHFIEQVTHPWNPGPMGRTNELLSLAGEFSANPSLLPLIEQATRWAEASGNRFNPAAGRLIQAWGLHTPMPPEETPPAPERLQPLLEAAPTMGDITIDGIRMRTTNPAVKLDLGEFARGAALQTAVDRLREAGVKRAALRAEESAFALGDGITLPVTLDGRPLRVVLPADTGLYVVHNSSDPFEHRERRYYRLINPRTGRPAAARAAAVIVPDMARGAAAATALAIAGVSEWREVAAAMEIQRAVLIDSEGRLHTTPAFASLLQTEPERSQ